MPERDDFHFRRRLLQTGAGITVLTSLSTQVSMSEAASMSSGFRFSLNTSTIQGEKIELVEQLRIASEAGYDGIELWLRDIERFLQSGGKLPEIRRMLIDLNLQVEGAIAFGAWIVDDESARKRGLQQCQRDMEIVRALGGRRIAAPPAGAVDGEKLDLDVVAERYRTLLEIGHQTEVIPQLEVWGFSKNLSRLSEVLYVATESHHPDACILPDIYHLYKGGTHPTDVQFLEGNRVHVFHMNDCPDIPRSNINDADRVYPGDGTSPISYILQKMATNGFQGVLSLELFNRTYWAQDPRLVAKTGLEKMKAAVANVI